MRIRKVSSKNVSRKPRGKSRKSMNVKKSKKNNKTKSSKKIKKTKILNTKIYIGNHMYIFE